MRVICTEKSQVLGTRLARTLDAAVVDVKYSRFPDGEQYLSAGGLDDETIIVGSVVGDEALVQLLLTIDACDTTRNTLVLPYMGYARQDRRFGPGEPVSARVVAQAASRGISKVITVNIHQKGVLGYFGVPARNISLAPEIGSYVRGLAPDDPLILAPDGGALAFARDVASTGGWEYDHLEKTRVSGAEVQIAPKQIAAGGRIVVIVDDIISTGGTIATASAMLRQQGATEIHAVCVHGVLSSGAYARLMASGVASVACSDTIERGCSMISAAGPLAKAIRGEREQRR